MTYKSMIPLSVLLSTSMNVHAIIGTDTAMLVQLTTTTASQLNELEKLVTNAEKYTKKMQEYNELFQDEYFKAERVLYLAQEVAARKEVENLGDLNMAIRDLKYSMEDLKNLMREYGQIKDEEKKTEQKVKIEKKLNEQNDHIAKKQVENSLKSQSMGRANQLTAQNTALIYEKQVQMHNTQLEILEKVATTNRLLAEEMGEKRKEQLEKQRSYNLLPDGKRREGK